MPLSVTPMEVVECPHKMCGILISGVPKPKRGDVFVCPFCRNGFEPNNRKVINVYVLEPIPRRH
jgi:hypothetical protein